MKSLICSILELLEYFLNAALSLFEEDVAQCFCPCKSLLPDFDELKEKMTMLHRFDELSKDEQDSLMPFFGSEMSAFFLQILECLRCHFLILLPS